MNKFYIKLTKNINNRIFLKNTFLNLFIKFFLFLTNIYIVSILYKFLNQHSFGLWEISLMFILNAPLLDLGITNFLRNFINKNILKSKYTKINKIINFSIFIFIIELFLFSIIFLSFIFINSNLQFFKDINSFLILSFISFFVYLIFNILNSIAFAIQKSYLTSLFSFLQSLLFLLFLLLIDKLNFEKTLILISILFIASLFISNFLFFYKISKEIKWFKYEFSFIEFKKYFNFIFDKSKQFGILQVLTFLFYTSDLFIIGNLFSINEAGTYSVVHKLFFYITTIFGIILIQLWNSSSQAYNLKDYHWIINIRKKLELCLLPVFFLFILINIFYKEIFIFWIDSSFKVNYNIIFLLSIITFFHLWTSIYINILNGINRLESQIKILIISNIFYIICVFLIYFFSLSINYFLILKILIIFTIFIIMKRDFNIIFKK